MNRRQVLKLGSSLGVLAGGALVARHVILPPPRSSHIEPVDVLAVRLFESLDDRTRARACVDYDHPLRQYHNRGVRGGGLAIGPGTFSRGQRGLLTDLLHAGLSEAGRERVPREFFIDWLGVHLLSVLVCGDPRTPPYQIVLSGPHLNLRLGGSSREGVAFGGPQVYGDQRGNERSGLPGNLYRYQFRIAQGLFATLGPEQQALALRPRAPIQTRIELQGSRGEFPGVAVERLSPSSKVGVRALIDGILSTYPPADVEYALRCLDAKGGIEGLFLSYYEDGRIARSDAPQIFRLEGPAAVFHFRGHPHVHAFVNVGLDGEDPLSVGEVLGHNPAAIEGRAVKELFEASMRARAGTDLAYYDEDSVVGRLRSGTIRTGDVYTLESWQDSIVTAEVKGSSIAAPLAAEMRARGEEPASGRVYSLATTRHVVADLARAKLGAVESRREGGPVRDATISYPKERGFPAARPESGK